MTCSLLEPVPQRPRTVFTVIASGYHFLKSTWPTLSGWLAVLLGFCLPLSKTVPEILMAILVFGYLVNGEYRRRLGWLWQNPLTLPAVGLLAALLLGVTYSVAETSAALHFALRYRELIHIPFLLLAFQQPKAREYGVLAFVMGMCVLLTMSYAEWLAHFGQHVPYLVDFVVTKDRIQHSILVSFLVMILLHARESSPRLRMACGGLMLVAVANLLFMVHSRTGYLVLGGLVTLYLVERWRMRGLIYATSLIVAVGVTGYATSSGVRDRLQQTALQIQDQFLSSTPHAPDPTWDPRLQFIAYSSRMIARHPWIGTGTGSFAQIFERDSNNLASLSQLPAEPHNEYLLITAQLGLPGLVLFLWLFVAQWRCSYRLPLVEARLSRGLVLTVALSCLFNSMLLGFTGAWFYTYFAALCCAPLCQPGNLLQASACGPRDQRGVDTAPSSTEPASSDSHSSNRTASGGPSSDSTSSDSKSSDSPSSDGTSPAKKVLARVA